MDPIIRRRMTPREVTSWLSAAETEELISSRRPIPFSRAGPNRDQLNGYREGILLRTYQRGGTQFFVIRVESQEESREIRVTIFDLDLLGVRMRLYQKTTP